MTRIAVALLVRDGRALLAHRHPDRQWYPDCWDLVGGHVEPGETPEQAVVRECREEMGIEIADPTPFAMAFDDPTLEVHPFVVTRWAGEPANVAPDEHDELRWFTVDEIASLTLADPSMLPGFRRAVHQAAATLSRWRTAAVRRQSGWQDRSHERRRLLGPRPWEMSRCRPAVRKVAHRR